MGSPFSFALSPHASSAQDRAEGGLQICYSSRVCGQKGTAEWAASSEGSGPSPSLSRVGQSSPKLFAECGLPSIKCKSNAGLGSSVSSGLVLKDSVDNALFHGVCAYIYIYVCMY